MGRGWWLPAAALAASLLLGAVPLAAGDPFRTTLPLIPWLAVVLAATQRWAAANGGHLRIPAASGELMAAGLLVLCILGRPHLGLGSSVAVDALLATGLVLVLAHRVAALVPSLLPCLRRKPLFVTPDKPQASSGTA